MAYKSTERQRERLYHRVVEQILHSIRAGDYRPGSRLPSERDLADKYQVSRVTIREATIALEAKGAIDIRAGSGAFVREFSSASELALPDVSAFDLTTARMIFEAEAAALAAANITDGELEKLAKIVEAMASNKVGGLEDGDDLDRQFHLTIAAAANNPAMEHCIRELWRMRNHVPQVKALYSRVCSVSINERQNEHSEIFLALKARDVTKARAAMREHFHRLFETMVSAQESAALDELRKSIGTARARYLQATAA
jgi:GntR family transcriptional repressor for pyruvate dehydrogenase complex